MVGSTTEGNFEAPNGTTYYSGEYPRVGDASRPIKLHTMNYLFKMFIKVDYRIVRMDGFDL
jgi:hypothetical protein